MALIPKPNLVLAYTPPKSGPWALGAQTAARKASPPAVTPRLLVLPVWATAVANFMRIDMRSCSGCCHTFKSIPDEKFIGCLKH